MKMRILLIVFTASLFIAFFCLKFFFSDVKNFSTFALGTTTIPYWAKGSNKNVIHISEIDSGGNSALIDSWKKSGRKNVLLVLGNSQSHSINQKQNGEVNYIELLSRQLHEYNVLANTFANASLQDFLISYIYWRSILPVKAVVIPVFLDDLRETNGITYNFFPRLVANNFKLVPDSIYLLQKLNNSFSKMREKELAVDSLGHQLVLSTQEKSEKYLNKKLENISDVWKSRKSAQGIMYSKLYELRNTVFNIKATTIRRMLPDRYADNMHSLDLIIRDAAKSGISIFLYLPPIRDDFDKPYDPKEYDLLKNQLRIIANRYSNNVYLRDFDSIVPGKYFGFKESTSLGVATHEIDFMHFKYHGHKILFDSLKVYLLKNGIK